MYLLTKATLTNFSIVKTHLRKGKKGTYVVKEFDRKNRIKKLLTTAALTTAGIASIGLLGVGGYKAIQAKTLKNIPKSVDWVKNNFSKYSDEMILTAKEAKQKSAVIALPGLFTDENEAIVSMINKNLKYKGKAFYNPLQSTIKDLPKSDNVYTQILNNRRYLINRQAQLGYNPTAREAAARAYAFHKNYPDKNIILFGHSWGGNTGNEAAKILEEIPDFDKNKLKMITLGTDHIRLIPKTNIDRADFVDAHDTLGTMFPYEGATKIPRQPDKDKVKAHFLYSYIKNFKQEIRDKLNEWNT